MKNEEDDYLDKEKKIHNYLKKALRIYDKYEINVTKKQAYLKDIGEKFRELESTYKHHFLKKLFKKKEILSKRKKVIPKVKQSIEKLSKILVRQKKLSLKELIINEDEKKAIINLIHELPLFKSINEKEKQLMAEVVTNQKRVVVSILKSLNGLSLLIKEQEKLIASIDLEDKSEKEIYNISVKTISKSNKLFQKEIEQINFLKSRTILLIEKSKIIVSEEEQFELELEKDWQTIMKPFSNLKYYLRSEHPTREGRLFEGINFFRCGLAKERFFEITFAAVEETHHKAINFYEIYNQHPLSGKNEILKEKLHLVQLALKFLGHLKELLKRYKKMQASFVELSDDPLINRAELIAIVEKARGDKEKMLKEYKKFEFFEKSGLVEDFLISRIKPIKTGTVYHGIGFHTGEAIKDNINFETVKTPREYAEAIVKRIDYGIFPTTADKNYNCCSELPAVCFYGRMGLWHSVCYIELNCTDYPVFDCTKEWSAAYYARQDTEKMVYVKESLQLLNYKLVFDTKKHFFPEHIIKSFFNPTESYIRKVIRRLPNKTPRGNIIKFTYKGKEWTPSKFKKALKEDYSL